MVGNLTYIYDGEISLNVNGPRNDSIYNLQGVITHEFGHILGLTHSDIEESIMFANPYHTSEYMRTLRQDDINGAFFLYPYSSCSECLSDWSEYTSGAGSVQSVVNSSDCCTFMNLSLSDTAAQTSGGRRKLFTNAVGMIATFNVFQIDGYDTLVGMGKVVGTNPAGNKIYAYIRLEGYNGQHRIGYKIYEEGTRNRTLSRGYFGDWDGMWIIGQDVTIGFARIENEIWFFSSSESNWLKIQMSETISNIDSQMILYGWVDKGSISSSIGKVCILYPNRLAVFPAPKLAGDFNNDGYIDLREAINALQIITGIRNQ